jgi:hypothetical protein
VHLLAITNKRHTIIKIMIRVLLTKKMKKMRVNRKANRKVLKNNNRAKIITRFRGHKEGENLAEEARKK